MDLGCRQRHAARVRGPLRPHNRRSPPGGTRTLEPDAAGQPVLLGQRRGGRVQRGGQDGHQHGRPSGGPVPSPGDAHGNFYTTSTKFHIDIIVRNNGYFSISQWQVNGLADKVHVALVIWVYGNCTIT